MNCCKKCQREELVRNGHIRGQQRYKCKSYWFSFILGDKCIKPETAAKRALAVILCSLGRASYGFIAKLFGSKKTVAWVLGRCSTAMFRKLYGKVKSLNGVYILYR